MARSSSDPVTWFVCSDSRKMQGFPVKLGFSHVCVINVLVEVLISSTLTRTRNQVTMNQVVGENRASKEIEALQKFIQFRCYWTDGSSPSRRSFFLFLNLRRGLLNRDRGRTSGPVRPCQHVTHKLARPEASATEHQSAADKECAGLVDPNTLNHSRNFALYLFCRILVRGSRSFPVEYNGFRFGPQLDCSSRSYQLHPVCDLCLSRGLNLEPKPRWQGSFHRQQRDIHILDICADRERCRHCFNLGWSASPAVVAHGDSRRRCGHLLDRLAAHSLGHGRGVQGDSHRRLPHQETENLGSIHDHSVSLRAALSARDSRWLCNQRGLRQRPCSWTKGSSLRNCVCSVDCTGIRCLPSKSLKGYSDLVL